MNVAARQDQDPLGWCALISAAFLALCWYRLALPSKLYFDEIHYVIAARKMLELVHANREHPLFAKEIMAASIALFGDKPFCWRMPSALFGACGLFAFGRLIWRLSARRFATIAGMILLATDFMWFVQSRIAMLDIFAVTLVIVALWQFAVALELPVRQARVRFILTGVALGLAMGSKWSILPAALIPGLTFLALQHFRPEHSEAVRRISLIEAGIWLGLFPLVVYWLTFAPAFFYAANDDRISPFGFIEQHREMVALQKSVVRHHPYQSTWIDWIINRRPIWYLYEHVDGEQRGILMLGNPFTMLAGLPAAAWCLWAGAMQKRRDALAFSALYLASLALWIDSSKPVQFYYHYLLPGTFLTGCLALALDGLMRRGGNWRIAARACLAIAAGMFLWFYPILSAAPLHEGEQSYVRWMWFNSWR